jgi:tryptophan synthase beta subunit
MGALDVSRQAPNVKKMRMLGQRHSREIMQKDPERCDQRAKPTGSIIRSIPIITSIVVGPHPIQIWSPVSVVIMKNKWQLDEQTGGSSPTALIACVGGGSMQPGLLTISVTGTVELIGVKQPVQETYQ